MKKISSQDLINQLIEENQSIIQIVQEQLASLKEEKLLWKPQANKWSILECLEHLNRANELYIGRIRVNVDNALEQNLSSSPYFRPGFWGERLTKRMRPDANGQIQNQMLTFRVFDPNHSQITPLGYNTLQDFIKNQEIIIKLLDKAYQVNLNEVKIKSVLGSLLRFRLGDAFRFVTAHTQRHIQQCLHVLAIVHSKSRDLSS